MNLKKFYQPEEIQKIIILINKGLSNSEITKQLISFSNRSEKGLYRKIWEIRKNNKIENKTVKNKIKFYSSEEIQLIKSELISGNTMSNVAMLISKNYNRSFQGAYYKVCQIKSKLNIIPPKIKQNVVQEVFTEEVVGIEMPKGMTFEGATKKIVLYPGYFKVYF